jgi:predicted site-specific integrase-resolvase
MFCQRGKVKKMQPGYISPKEAGAIAGRSARTIRMWLDFGYIDGFVLAGRWEVKEESLYKYIKECMGNKGNN